MEETAFDPAAHKEFLSSIEAETKQFMTGRNAAGKAEGERENVLLQQWRERKAAEAIAESENAVETDGRWDCDVAKCTTDYSSIGVTLLDLVSPLTASLWKVLVAVGDTVKNGQTLAILEAMKMEIREYSLVWHGVSCTDPPCYLATQRYVRTKAWMGA